MARIVKEEEYAVKRREILVAAQKLVYTRGYERMSIQDILDEIGISKGAFYHYFDSKLALLDGLVDLMLDEVEQVLRPILEADDLPAIEKLRGYFETGSRWKIERKSFMLDLLRVWYTDSNALVRQKQEAAAIKRIAPMLAKIIRQGIAEGVFTAEYPDQIGSMVWSLAQGISDNVAELLLTQEPHPDALERLKMLISAYSDALERILGAPPGSLPLADVEMIKAWVMVPAQEKEL